MNSIIISGKIPLPDCLKDKCSEKDYAHWLRSKARAHVKRDKKRGNTTCSELSYRNAIHQAVCKGGDKDAFTGEELKWDLIRKYDNAKSKAGKRAYKKDFALLPTVDHLDDGSGAPNFAICGWRTNDCKNDLSIDELKNFCSLFLNYQAQSCK